MPVASRAVQMIHKVDPKVELQRAVQPLVDSMEVLGAQVLIAVYVRPEKTAGGILLTEETRGEDNLQGKIGLVLKLGSIAFDEDADHKFPVKPQVGDWVMFRIGDTFEFVLGKHKFRLADDVAIRAIVARPDIVL
jgi:co-chaperonin GroES (HSP10)